MALTDVVSGVQTDLLTRGNSGTVVDVDSERRVDKLFIDVPVVGEVQSGVQYGQQGTELTGSYVGGGSGGGIRVAGHGGLAS